MCAGVLSVQVSVRAAVFQAGRPGAGAGVGEGQDATHATDRREVSEGQRQVGGAGGPNTASQRHSSDSRAAQCTRHTALAWQHDGQVASLRAADCSMRPQATLAETVARLAEQLIGLSSAHAYWHGTRGLPHRRHNSWASRRQRTNHSLVRRLSVPGGCAQRRAYPSNRLPTRSTLRCQVPRHSQPNQCRPLKPPRQSCPMTAPPTPAKRLPPLLPQANTRRPRHATTLVQARPTSAAASLLSAIPLLSTCRRRPRLRLLRSLVTSPPLCCPPRCSLHATTSTSPLTTGG